MRNTGYIMTLKKEKRPCNISLVKVTATPSFMSFAYHCKTKYYLYNKIATPWSVIVCDRRMNSWEETGSSNVLSIIERRVFQTRKMIIKD